MTKELPEWFLEASEVSFCSLRDHDCHSSPETPLPPLSEGNWARGQPPWDPASCGLWDECSLPHRNPRIPEVKASVMHPPSCEQTNFKEFSDGRWRYCLGVAALYSLSRCKSGWWCLWWSPSSRGNRPLPLSTAVLWGRMMLQMTLLCPFLHASPSTLCSLAAVEFSKSGTGTCTLREELCHLWRQRVVWADTFCILEFLYFWVILSTFRVLWDRIFEIQEFEQRSRSYIVVPGVLA